MKKLVSILCIAFSIGIAKAQVTKVLFLGNSYTGVNNLPSLVQNVALSFGDTLFIDSNTPGGATFNAHSTNSTTLSKIAQGTWDYVTLQAQSQEPSFSPAQVAAQTYPYAATLVNAIRSANSCTEPVFFMTWGRKNGDASNCVAYPPICTYAGMQQRLRESYLEMANDNQTTVSPVGVAWKNVRDSFPLIELYSPDESHPSIYGSYLAACVFYATFYQKSPIGSTYIPSGINASEALNLQTIASNTVLDSLTLWRVNANKPIANFNYSGGGTINFTNTSTNGAFYFWDFGDGNTSSLENPSNTYTSSNTYPVQLIIFSNDSCFSDTIIQNINVTTVGINRLNTTNETNIYPNPASAQLTVLSQFNIQKISIIDITGKTMKSIIPATNIINVADLPNGIYFIKIIGKEKTITKKFIKN